MESKLRKIYGTGGSWVEIVEKQMDFPSTMPEQVQQMWKGYVRQAQKRGLEANPNEFALQLVDENF